jgi:NADH-quinone oxidoreductase subunit K
VELWNYQLVALFLFAIGVAVVLIRRNLLIALMGIELMLNAANLSLVAFSRQHADQAGQIFALLVMLVAAIEVAVGLALVISLARSRDTLDLEELDLMRW